MVKTAVILAAGLGVRFGRRTEFIPKGFVEVNGRAMVIRSIETLIACGIERIIVGTGYRKELYEQLCSQYPQIECCPSEHYATTNSLWTLENCCEAIGSDDFLLLESDLIYEPRAITALLTDRHEDIMLIADETKFQDQYFVEHDPAGNLTACSTHRDELHACGELVGIHRLSNSFYRELCDFYRSIRRQSPKLGYEFGLLHLAQHGHPMYVLKVADLKWYEIEDEQDLAYAEKLNIPG